MHQDRGQCRKSSIAELEAKFRKLTIAKHRPTTSHGHPRRQRTISCQVPSVIHGLPSPPESDGEGPLQRRKNHDADVRKLLSNQPSSRVSSFASQLHSPPGSEFELDGLEPDPKNKENKPGPGTLRRRRPLLFAFPDGPADEGSLKPQTPVTATKTTEPVHAPSFPLQPVPNIITNNVFPTAAETEKKSQRRAVHAVSQRRDPTGTPDRFISSRSASQDATRRFNLNKRTNELSSNEKLLRNDSASPDPFESPTATRVGRRHVSTNRQSPSRSASRTAGGTNLLNPSGSSPSAAGRQFSNGAVWNLGGSSVTTPSGPVDSVPDGHGGYVGSGTNAPIYTSRFFERDPPQLNRGRLERRVAAALDIDTTTRVFNRSQSPERGRSRTRLSGGSSSRSRPPHARTRWQDGQWFKEGSSSRKQVDASFLMRNNLLISMLGFSI